MSLDFSNVPRLTREQAAIIVAYTGICCGLPGDLQAIAEYLLARPVWTHELPLLRGVIKEKARELFLSICNDE
jgi:hypothetical protein